MRKMTRFLVVAAVSVATTKLQADHGSHVNRYFGLGWGDGYHVGTNTCMGSGGWSPCLANRQVEIQPYPAVAAKVPMRTPVPTPAAHGRTQFAHPWPATAVQPAQQGHFHPQIATRPGPVNMSPVYVQPAPQAIWVPVPQPQQPVAPPTFNRILIP